MGPQGYFNDVSLNSLFRKNIIWPDPLRRGSLGQEDGDGHGDPLQYSCLENPMGWGAWWATVQRVTELETTEATERTRVHREAFPPVAGHLWECLHSKTSQRHTGPLQGWALVVLRRWEIVVFSSSHCTTLERLFGVRSLDLVSATKDTVFAFSDTARTARSGGR